MRRHWRYGLALGLPALVVATGSLAQDDQFDFMPPGGRALLLDLVDEADTETLAEIVARDQSAEDWKTWAMSREPDLDDKALATFSGYAELNLPVADNVLSALAESGDASLLPLDGKDLAIAQCQFCHALFSGYLTHDRDETGWKGTFKSPFHMEIRMSEVERDTFARYSAINMPLRYEDVPPELRF